jgi:GTP-binding protein EngB required for normal cell division
LSLADVIGRWIGRVEVVLAGADEDLREGEEALAAGDPMRARAAAHRVLDRAPESPLGLALLADACDKAQLDAELALTLEELSRRVPSQAEVWVRLARARRATQAPPDEVRDALVRALAVAQPGSEARRDALLELTDLDLAQGDYARAELWLERAALPEKSPSTAIRRAEAMLLRGAAAGANKLLEPLTASAADGRVALARGRALTMLGDPAAFMPLVRALVLDTPGASEALSSALASVPSDTQVRARVRSVVDAKGEQDWTRWRAAFARAEGAGEAARRALRDAVEAGDLSSARPLLDAAIDDRDTASLLVALRGLGPDESDSLISEARLLASATTGGADADPDHVRLDRVARVTHPRLVPWAETIATEVARAWVPTPPAADRPPRPLPADWPKLLTRLDAHARLLGDLQTVAAIADLAAERTRPLRLAIIGEFNAGKSTFINALIGADVAPTGVLPTTATLHHLRWAPDPIARISFLPGGDPPERIVPLGDLRKALKSLDAGTIRRVELLLPLAFLVRVEILDTPGFNAPDRAHERAARSAFDEADAAIWLLDATQALKQSERAVLEEVQRARLPLQMLINKADRLTADDLAQVTKNVAEALAETHLGSLTPPLPLSAKKALAGKMGDLPSLSESGWGAIETLLEEQIIARHEELKERALRRRAARIVARLAEQASTEAERRRSEDEALAARAHAIAHTAARIERDADAVAEELSQSLSSPAQAWGRDLELVFIGRERKSAVRDPILARYRVDRAVAALAPSLARIMASLSGDEGLDPSQWTQSARALVRAAADASEGAHPESLLAPLARAAVATLVERLFSLSVAPPAKPGPAGLLRELRALAAALD